MNISDVDFAWFVGMFEGEGSFAFQKGIGSEIKITSTDLDVLEKIQSIVGGVIFLHYGADKSPGWKACWIWRSNVTLAEELIPKMIPLLGKRRAARGQEWIDSRNNLKNKKKKVSILKQQIAEAVFSGKTQRQVAKDFDVSQPYVSKVYNEMTVDLTKT